MNDRETIFEICRRHRWGNLALIIAANAAAVSLLIAAALLLLLAGLHALDWMGVLPCSCA